MNMVSWFVYIADVIGNITLLLQWATSLCAITFVVTLCVKGINSEEPLSSLSFRDAQAQARWDNFHKTANKILKRTLVIVIVCASLVAVIPSKQTMYVIAASEVTERVITSEAVQSVVDPTLTLIRSYLDEQIKYIRSR